MLNNFLWWLNHHQEFLNKTNAFIYNRVPNTWDVFSRWPIFFEHCIQWNYVQLLRKEAILFDNLSKNRRCGTLLIWHESIIHANNTYIINYLIFSKEYTFYLIWSTYKHWKGDGGIVVFFIIRSETQFREGKCFVLCVYGRAEIKHLSADFKSSFIQCTGYLLNKSNIYWKHSLCQKLYLGLYLYYLIHN